MAGPSVCSPLRQSGAQGCDGAWDQVSEGVARKVSAVPGQPFQFEPGHKTYCKGFGAVTSYFVRSNIEPPPKDLMVQLGLKPSLGMFYFDNLISGPKRNTDVRLFAPGTAGMSGAGSQGHSQARETHSQHSHSNKDTNSQTSGSRNANPTIRDNGEAVDFLDDNDDTQ